MDDLMTELEWFSAGYSVRHDALGIKDDSGVSRYSYDEVVASEADYIDYYMGNITNYLLED